MDHLLSLSKAAKLAGVSRRTIQEKIRNGGLQTFEGEIRMSELLAAYPTVHTQSNTMLEKVARIQANASHKVSYDGVVDERVLASQVQRLQRQLLQAQAEIDAYQDLVNDLKDRLVVATWASRRIGRRGSPSTGGA